MSFLSNGSPNSNSSHDVFTEVVLGGSAHSSAEELNDYASKKTLTMTVFTVLMTLTHADKTLNLLLVLQQYGWQVQGSLGALSTSGVAFLVDVSSKDRLAARSRRGKVSFFSF